LFAHDVEIVFRIKVARASRPMYVQIWEMREEERKQKSIIEMEVSMCSRPTATSR